LTYGPHYRILFISDIRSGDPRKLKNDAVTKIISHDNALQAACCYALHCDVAMLKFHPPYPKCLDSKHPSFDPSDTTPAVIEYFDGDLYFGVWAPKSSTEVRLVVRGPFLTGDGLSSKRAYNLTEFEEQLYYYNTENRWQADVLAERTILKNFLGSTSADFPTDDAIASLSQAMSEFLGHAEFLPLDPCFSEADGRLFACLLLAKRTDLWLSLRGQVLLKDIVALAEGATPSLPKDFLVIANANPKIILECYSVPLKPSLKK
jgi:cap2 methyltransferase